MTDLLIKNAELVATSDGREIPGGWVAITGTQIEALGGPGTEPVAGTTLDAGGSLVTPGLINTHHHIYQNLTRAYSPALKGGLFEWLTALYPLWANLDEEAIYISAYIGLAELALGGCTTTTDHLYVHPRPGFIDAEIRAARDIGFRFHPTRGSMSRSQKDGGLPPDSVVQTDDEILADSERLIDTYHDPGPDSMLRIGLAPCSPFSVTPELMRATVELAERRDVRLHTHLCESPDEDRYCLEVYGRRPVEQLEHVGWGTDRVWVAHCVYPNDREVERLGGWGVGVAHCPSSMLMIGCGVAHVAELRAFGSPVGLGCDGSASTDHASLWLEARTAMMLGKMRLGAASMSARDVLDIATKGSAACLGRGGELGVLRAGAPADVVVWQLPEIAFAGAHTDLVEAWLRCGPVSARHTVVNGKVLVRDGELELGDLAQHLARHRAISLRLQGIDD